ncbi:MAG: hypothetical protein N4A35_16150 [Flavobacteriales bacterium]|jgi:hypothetical protein|nr:hypothetical protein [Flavobacteriales bacterium]
MNNTPQLSILKTDIKSRKKLKIVQPIFNNHNDIFKWTVDLEDIDNVLRVEHHKNLSEDDIIQLVKVCGFYGEPLES